MQRALALPVDGERVGSLRDPHRRAAVLTRWRRTGQDGGLMSSLRTVAASVWPDDLVEYDPDRWSSRHAWHLARAYAAPTRLDALNEIRAARGRPPLGVWPVALTGVREQLGRRGGAADVKPQDGHP